MGQEELICISWSGGKDSAYTLYRLLSSGKKIHSLLTTFCAKEQSVFHHNTPLYLIQLQAQSCQIPLIPIFIPPNSTALEYARIMKKQMLRIQSQGVNTVAFGDIFLEKMKENRTKNLCSIGMNAIFPLWKESTSSLAQKIVNSGLDAKIVSIDTSCMEKKYLGKNYSESLSGLPNSVDPCGENGEFHTFVFTGPMFTKQIPFHASSVKKSNKFNSLQFNLTYKFTERRAESSIDKSMERFSPE